MSQLLIVKSFFSVYTYIPGFIPMYIFIFLFFLSHSYLMQISDALNYEFSIFAWANTFIGDI